MKATETRGANLAVRPTHPIEPRLEKRRRRVAFVEIVADARRLPAAWYAHTRRDPRNKLPSERERELIHEAIRAGATTPERVIAYRLFQMRDDLAQFSETPALAELLYVQMIREEAEAIDAQSTAHALPTPAHLDTAVRETEKASLLGRAFCVLARSGRLPLHGARS